MYTDKVVDPIQVWKDHQQRLADIERLYPSRWPLILRYHSPGPYFPRRIPPSDLLSKTLEPHEKPFAFNYAGKNPLCGKYLFPVCLFFEINKLLKTSCKGQPTFGGQFTGQEITPPGLNSGFSK